MAKKARPRSLAAVKALEKTLGLIPMKEGKDELPAVSTGNPLIDYGFGGFQCSGLPRGHIIELYGPESCGKSTLAAQIAIDCLRKGGTVVYNDYEHTMRHQYVRTLGMDFDDDNFFLYQPEYFEQGAHIAGQFLAAGVDLIIYDSLAAMVPRKILESDNIIDKDDRLGLHAALTGRFCKLLNYWNTKYGKQTAVLFLNQMRTGINLTAGGGNSAFETTTGGKALRHYASIRMSMKVIGKELKEFVDPLEKTNKKIPLNMKVRFICVKNKVTAQQGSSVVAMMRFGEGFDKSRTVLDLAQLHELVVKSGSWYSYKTATGEELMKVQGIEQVRTFMQDNEAVYLEIEKSLMTLVEKLSKTQMQVSDSDLKRIEAKGAGTDDDDEEDDLYITDEDRAKFAKNEDMDDMPGVDGKVAKDEEDPDLLPVDEEQT